MDETTRRQKVVLIESEMERIRAINSIPRQIFLEGLQKRYPKGFASIGFLELHSTQITNHQLEKKAATAEA